MYSRPPFIIVKGYKAQSAKGKACGGKFGKKLEAYKHLSVESNRTCLIPLATLTTGVKCCLLGRFFRDSRPRVEW